MRACESTFRLLLTVTFLPFLVGLVRAQETTPDDLRLRIQSIKESQEYDEATRAKIVEDLESAIAHLERIPNLQKSGERFRSVVEQGAGQVAALKEELANLPKEPATAEQVLQTFQFGKDTPVGVAETAWREAAAQLNQLKNQRDTKLAAIRNEEARPAKIEQDELPQIRTKLEEIAKALNEPQPVDVPLSRWSARRELLLARQRARLAEQLALQQELLASPVQLQILSAERDLIQRQVYLAEARERHSREFYEARRKEAEAEERRREQEEIRAAVGKHPTVRRMAERNQELRGELDQITTELAATEARSKQLLESAAELQKDYQRTTELLEVAESGLEMANVLRSQRETLQAYVRDLEEEKEIRKRLTRVSVRSNDVRNQLEALEDLEQERLRLFRSIPFDELDADGYDGLFDALWELHGNLGKFLQTRNEILEKLAEAYPKYGRALVELDNARLRLVEASEPLARLLDEGLMWMPSGKPLTHESLPRIAEGAAKFVQQLHPEILWRELQELSLDEQTLIALAFLYSLAVVLTRGRHRERTAKINRKLGRVHEDSFWLTTNALFVTVLRAGTWAVPCLALSSLPTIGPGLRALAPFLFFLHFLWLVIRPDGLGGAHFRWDKAFLADVRGNLRWLVPTLCLATFVAAQQARSVSLEETHGLARVMVILALVSLSVLFARLFRISGPLHAHLEKRARQSWLFRLRKLWWTLVVMGPLALAILAAVGYYYTSLRLAQPMTRSIQIVLGVFLIQGVVFRYLAIAQRRVALKRALERRDAALEKGEALEDLPQVEAPEFDLSTINQQTRHLIRTFSGLGLIVALWFAWQGVFTSFSVLDSVTLWSTSVSDGNGGTIDGAFTLTDFMLLAIIAVGTVAAARNLPGVLEILVLNHLPLDSGGRYATTTISRYVITGTGIVLAFDAIGVGWSNVQWLVAALGVGLGFGLQEIFANFVSGLIIFFERRIRVGDIVTVDGVDGVVSKIRILGTTITNWDRKEYIVPNKEFVTGKLLNWTLSDSINRLVLNIGVAYGSDTEKALQLLMKAAEEHPDVLEDPAPFATFEVFGDSTLNLVLRCYLADLSGRLRTLTQLNQAIDRMFREAGIEIAFPQRDLHVRSIELPEHLIRKAQED